MINNIFRIIFLFIFVSIIILGILAISIYEQRPGEPVLDETIVLRMAESVSKNDPLAEVSREFAENISDKTDGRIKIEIFYNNELGSSSQAIEQLQFGGIAFAKVNILDLVDKYPQLDNVLEVGDYGNRDIAYSQYKNAIDETQKILELENIRILAMYYPELRIFAGNLQLNNRESNFKDLKIAVQRSRILEKQVVDLGAIPITLMPSSEMKAINEGYLNLIEMPLVKYIQNGYSTILPYVTVNNNLYSSEVLIMSDLIFATLDLNMKAAISQSSQTTVKFYNDSLQETEAEIMLDYEIGKR